MEEVKLSDKDFITLILKEDNIECSIKYSKQSSLEKRFKTLDKIKDFMRKV